MLIPLSLYLSCEYLEILAQFAGVLGQHGTNPGAPIDSSAESLYRTNSRVSISSIASSAGSLFRTNSRVSINSIASFAGSVNTKKAFKTFCNDLYGVGVTEEVISQKKAEILNMLVPQNTATSDDSNVVDDGQLPAVSNCSIFVDRNIYINRR